jgi:predicted ATPase
VPGTDDPYRAWIFEHGAKKEFREIAIADKREMAAAVSPRRASRHPLARCPPQLQVCRKRVELSQMLTRLYIDNFRCFEKFEYRPARKNLIIGWNGSGKSSLLDALSLLQRFVADGESSQKLFRFSERTRWLTESLQTFELDAVLNSRSYLYQLVIESPERRPRVFAETLKLDGKPILEFKNGEVQVFNNRAEPEHAYPLDPNHSALLTISSRKTDTIHPFKRWLTGICALRLNPFAMGSRAEGESLYPAVDLSDVASWYRHLLQSDPEENASLVESLREALDGFSSLRLEPAGEDRLLFAVFNQGTKSNIKFRFKQLSDGQRCLICLYIVLHFVLAKGGTVIIDEPENFVSLAEIQPWLVKVADIVEERKGQVLLFSHHPELINQWAPSHGVQFIRDGVGSVRVEPFHGDPDSSLPPAELVARGWERG